MRLRISPGRSRKRNERGLLVDSEFGSHKSYCRIVCAAVLGWYNTRVPAVLRQQHLNLLFGLLPPTSSLISQTSRLDVTLEFRKKLIASLLLSMGSWATMVRDAVVWAVRAPKASGSRGAVVGALSIFTVVPWTLREMPKVPGREGSGLKALPVPAVAGGLFVNSNPILPCGSWTDKKGNQKGSI